MWPFLLQRLGMVATVALSFPAVAMALPAAESTEMVVIPEGEFLFGDDQGEPDEPKARRIPLKAFAIDRTEVTAAAYERCVSAGHCKKPLSPLAVRAPPAPNLPVVGVSFTDARAYCAFLGKRLPSELEWEKAARGPDGRRYPWGDVFECGRGNFGNYGGDGRCAEEGAPGRPVKVGSFPTGDSPYGVHDLAGNVWEWVEGRYRFSLLTRPELRILRGGGCCSIFGLPRASDRLALPENYRDIDIGFRCAASLLPP